MLNTPCKRPAPLKPGQEADWWKIGRFYRNRARCAEAAAANSSGHIRARYEREAGIHHHTALECFKLAIGV